MCFVPHQDALSRPVNCPKWSETGMLCAFWLRHVLCATTACTFWTPQLLKVVCTWFVLCISASTCASRRSHGQFFISHLTKCLRTHRFTGSTIMRKTRCFSTLLPFRAPASSFLWLSFLIFFLILLSSLTLPLSAFHLFIFSDVWQTLAVISCNLYWVSLGSCQAEGMNIYDNTFPWVSLRVLRSLESNG